MTLTLFQLLLAYVIGGVTFIPLVLAAVLVPAWLALPNTSEGEAQKEEDLTSGTDRDVHASEKLQVPTEGGYTGDGEDGTASGTFAVLRKYDLPAAIAALTTRHGAQQSGGTGSGVDEPADAIGGSESVYQSMYRSVFDRTRTSTPPSALPSASDDENTSSADARTRRKASKPAPANVYFIVLRHGHLMLYDSSAQLEVRHVISLAHYDICLSDGDEADVAADGPMTDGDLFIKRTAILLSPKSPTASGASQTPALPSKPFYMFATTSIKKESFYHSLLLASPAPPAPQALDPHDLIKLQTTLHGTLMTPETRALNAIVSRIFLALNGTDLLKHFFRAKIEKKISRVQKPGFINTLALHAIDLGNAAPVVANLRLKDLNVSGDVTISCDVRYTGGMSLALAAQARLDLGPRFKARTVDLLLSSTLKRLSGHMLVRIKPPPSNRLWFCFDGMPDMEIKIEPVVSTRQITYGFILRQIEEKIRAVVAETLVKPNWDDIPFFDTRDQKVRGGIWASESESGEEEESTVTEPETLASRGEKTMSMPVLTHTGGRGGASSGMDNLRSEQEAELKRRSVMSLPASASSSPHLAAASELPGLAGHGSRPLRSPSLTSPAASSPSVALDDSAAKYDPSHKAPPQKSRTWGRRPLASPPKRKEAVDAVREMRDRSLNAQDTESPESDDDGVRDRVSEDDEGSLRTADRTTTGLSARSTASSASASTAGTASSAKSESIRQKRAANLLAAATTATTAAKNWSWNAIQNRAAKGAAGRRSSDLGGAPSPQEPMGRGQPLPPPGMPLPGPEKDKSLWAGSGFGVPGFSGSLKRKPVLPRRPVDKAHEQPGDDNQSKTKIDEFGEWTENSGTTVADDKVSETEGSSSTNGTETAVPPPLPRRRRPEDRSQAAKNFGHDIATPEPGPALSAARLATASKAHADQSVGATNTDGKHVADTPAQDTQSPRAAADQVAHFGASNDAGSTSPDVKSALPALPVDSETLFKSKETSTDSDDLVVVAAPVESGRNTPLPGDHASEKAAKHENGVQLPDYGGSEWGAPDDDYGEGRWGAPEDEDVEEEEGMPKASFSRSRDDGFDLHQ